LGFTITFERLVFHCGRRFPIRVNNDIWDGWVTRGDAQTASSTYYKPLGYIFKLHF